MRKAASLFLLSLTFLNMFRAVTKTFIRLCGTKQQIASDSFGNEVFKFNLFVQVYFTLVVIVAPADFVLRGY
jgi:hypothetical protein